MITENASSNRNIKCEVKKQQNAWLKYSEEEKQNIYKYNEGYKEFISICKTERECVREVIKMAEAHGFHNMLEVNKICDGDKLYVNNMGKNIVLFAIGSLPLEEGMKLLSAHIDSPRLDLKQVTLYEDTEMAFFDTHYYGGIKKYQWVTLPLAIHGILALKDGNIVSVVIGEDDADPVVGISDLLIHLATSQMEKKGYNVVEGEDLNVLVGSIPLANEEKDAVKANILSLLMEKYGIIEDDFLSAELEVVPAGRARDFGIDRSMIIGYGQDDRVCVYNSIMALFQAEKTDHTAVCLLVDKEEVGNTGATGTCSKFFENTVAELLIKQGVYSEIKVRRALQNSQMLSSDACAAFDPNYPSVMEKKNSAYFGRGIVFNKYVGSRGKFGCNDANAEYFAILRRIMETNDINFQTSELGKVDEGGGGTISHVFAQYNMQVIDCGVAVLNMHAPWEITSKVDIYETMKGFNAFLGDSY